MTRPMDYTVALAQIGRGNLAAVSGGRYKAHGGEQAGGRRPMVMALDLPVAHGHTVRITLNALDLYDVERLYTRNGKTWVKATWTNVYAADLGDTAYRASCYKDAV